MSRLDLLQLNASDFTFAALDYEPRRARDVTLVAGHGYSSSKQNLDGLASFLAAQGFRVVSIDFPGHKLGASGGILRGLGDLIATMSAAVAYARRHYPGPVYTLGHSMGAMTALRCCAYDAAVAGAISIATGYGRLRALEALTARGTTDFRASYVDGLSLPELAAAVAADEDAMLERLVGRPVLYVAAERDMMVGLAAAEELYARAPEPKTYATVPSDHTTAADNARAAVLGWLNALHPRSL